MAETFATLNRRLLIFDYITVACCDRDNYNSLKARCCEHSSCIDALFMTCALHLLHSHDIDVRCNGAHAQLRKYMYNCNVHMCAHIVSTFMNSNLLELQFQQLEFGPRFQLFKFLGELELKIPIQWIFDQ